MRASFLLILTLLMAGCSWNPPTSLPAESSPPQAPGTESVPPVESDDPVAALEQEMADHDFRYSAAAMTELAVNIILDLNAARQAEGVPQFQSASQLMRLSSLRAQDMIALGYFDHLHPRRGTVEADRLLRAEGVRGPSSELLFESTGPGTELPAAAVAAWLADPPNRRAVLSPEYQYLGVGVMGDGDRWVVVALLTRDQP